MAFNKKNFGGNIGAGSACPNLYSFADTASTKAGIAGADYFIDLYTILNVGDGIYCQGSDGAMLLSVLTSTSAGVTTEEATLA